MPRPVGRLPSLPGTDDQPSASAAASTAADEVTTGHADEAPGEESSGEEPPSDQPSGEPPAESQATTATREEAEPRTGRRIPPVVWWVMALHVTMLGAYSILLPTFRAPDEPLHVDLAHHWSTDFEYPAWDDRATGDGIINSLFRVRFPGRSAHLTAQEAIPKDERPSFEDLDTVSQGGTNHLPQHPPLYYAVAGTAERAVEVVAGDPDFHVETWFYRLVSIAMVAPLPIVIWRVSRLMGLPDPVAVGAMLLPLAIPQYLHIGASVNNDNLQFLTTWLMTPLVLRVGRGDLSRGLMVVAGVVSGLGLLTKAFTFAIPMWMACALVVVLVRQGRAALPRVAGAGLLYGVVTVVAGGWWWIRNLVVYGSLMPTRYLDLVRPVPRDDLDIVDYMQKWITGTLRRFWGEFGYFDTRIPQLAVTIATTVVVVTLLAALIGRDRVTGSRLGDRLLLLAPLVLLMAVQFQSALTSYLEIGQYAALQGRYWFGAIAALAVLVALGAAKLVGPFRRWIPFGVLAAVVVMHGLAVSAILGFYWGEPGAPISDRLRAVVAWAPLPSEVVVVAAAVGAVVVVLAVFEVGRMVVKSGHDAGADPQLEAATASS